MKIEATKMCNILSSFIKPELNHIYTQSPFYTEGGLDFGWFCREHALHLFVLGKLLGYEAKIILGDFEIICGEGDVFSSIGEDSGHAWCCIGSEVPVDISIVTQYLCENSPDMGLVYGKNKTSGAYSVIYQEHDLIDLDLFKKSIEDHKPAIGFLEKEILELDPITCLEQPFDFLFKPHTGKNYVQINGEDIFFQITWHCYRLAFGETKSLRYRKPKDAVNGIIKFNRNAREEIYKQLKKY